MRAAGALGCVLLVIGCGAPQSSPPVVETVVVKPTGPAAPTTQTTDPAPVVAALDPLPPPPLEEPTPLAPVNGAPGCAPFDRGAAASALGAVNLQKCARPNGVRGAGHVKITFAIDGHVSAAVIDAGSFAGTAEGACIASAFRPIRIPAFCGAPVNVGKAFTIN